MVRSQKIFSKNLLGNRHDEISQVDSDIMSHVSILKNDGSATSKRFNKDDKT
jgi:hypothetical protein